MTVQNVSIGVLTDFRVSANRFFLPGASEFASTLNLGQIIKGKVMRQYEGARYLVNFGGHERVVDSAIPLTTGELIHGRVIGLGERVEMQRVYPLGQDTEAASTREQPTPAAFATLLPQERVIEEYSVRYRAELSTADRAVLVQASRMAGDAGAMALVGVMVNKLGLRQMPALLWPLYHALLREDSSSAALMAAREMPRLGAEPGAEAGAQASAVRQLADFLFKQIDRAGERKEQNDTATAPPRGVSRHDAPPPFVVAPAGFASDDPDEDEGADPRRLAHWLLNVQTGGTVAHRIGTVPLLLDDKLIEVDLAFFEQRRDTVAVPQTKHRKVVFSLRTEHLGNVEIAASVAGPRVRLQIATGDSEATGEVAAYVEDLRAALAAGGWEVDELSYETRDASSHNGVVRSVVEHVVSQDSLNRLI